MAELTPLGVVVTDARTDVRGAVSVPGTREVLENWYNDFLDHKQKGEVALDLTFDAFIGMSINMLKNHRAQELREQWGMGQIGRAEYDALEEYRKKLIVLAERADANSYGFDQYGVQYIQTESRHLFREKVGSNEVLTAQHRDVHIKTSNGSGVLKG
jgi:hypothetical protein